MAPGSMEYGTDTTRAIMGVAFSGDAARFPDVRFIWSHAGGTVPFLAGRIEGASTNAKDRLPNGFIAEIRKFYYDLAGASNRGAGVAARTRQALAGALRHRFPAWRDPRGGVKALAVEAVQRGGSAGDRRDNAVRLLPRLGKS